MKKPITKKTKKQIAEITINLDKIEIILHDIVVKIKGDNK